MNIYIAANYNSHPQMREVAARLREIGHEVDCEWIKGIHQADDHHSYAEIDLSDLDRAECCVLFSEDFAGSRTRGGKHVEFGYALAKGKRLIVVGERRNVFHYLSRVENVPDADALIMSLRAETPVRHETEKPQGN